jgi:hypothetical protein
MLKRLLYQQVSLRSLTIGRLIAALSVLGIIALAYLYGAAVMFFQLPSFLFLHEAFVGAKAWHQRGQSMLPPLSSEEADEVRKKEGVTVDQEEKTYDGFTLYTTTVCAQATLIDMRGKVVHRWGLPFSKAWTHAPHVKNPLPDDQINWFHCYLYPNGDLLAVYHADGDTPYGYGLVKIDKDSRLLWAYANHCHHDVDVGEDGTIYTLAQRIVSEPPAGLEFLPTPYLADSVIALSPEGQELHDIPIAEAFANSPSYALTLGSSSKQPARPFGDPPAAAPAANSSNPPEGTGTPTPPAGPRNAIAKNDVLHTNSVKVLSRARAAKFPLFKAGQVLLSLRTLNAIAVLDCKKHAVVWAARGIWQVQHDAEFLDNGHLLLYDNFGAHKQTRILEYDPQTQAIPWAYTNESSNYFHAVARGMKQRLPNGNTLIVDPDDRRLFEVTRDKELVWQIYCPLPSDSSGQRSRRHAINCARRYGAGQLPFLKGAARPRS